MRFSNQTEFPSLNKVIDKVNELLLPDSPMIKYVIEKNDWRYDVKSGFSAAQLLSHMPTTPVSVQMYYASNPGSAQTASWDGKRIGINQYWFPYASTKAVTSALIHEWAHACGFHHRDPGWLGKLRQNYWTKNKSLYSVPYHLSDNVGMWL